MTIIRCTVIAVATLLTNVVAVRAVSAQQPTASSVTREMATQPPRREVTRSLERIVSVHLSNVSLETAVTAIARAAEIELVMSDESLPPGRTVSVDVDHISAGEAFRRVLRGTGVELAVSPAGKVILSRVAKSMATGMISGTVTDGATTQAVRGASVALDDSGAVVRTRDDGQFVFRNVSAGPHKLSVRSVGYARQTRLVTVTDEQTVTADFALVSSVNTLDQVVVTVTGAQHYRELGHVVAQINADSLVKAAPITSVSELLTARVPGLQVLPGNGGVVGGDVALRLRGQTTTNLDPQPIVIVDGVRYKSTSRTIGDNNDGNGATRPFGAEPRSPLNDLNVNDIETIDVVKGPSASTLYGPDAANGVIVVTTKRGKPGKPVWHVYAYPDLAMQPKTDATTSAGYRAWGHDPNTGETVPFNCDLQRQVEPAQCVLDSITVVPRTNDAPQYAVLAKSRPQWHSGANVSGGTPGLTYFFSGNYDSETGSLQVSPLAARVLKEQLGVSSLSQAIRNPNTQQTFTAHADLATQLNATTNLNLTASYTNATQRAIAVSFTYGNNYTAGTVPPYVDTTNLAQLAGALPTYAFLNSTQLHLNRWTAAARGGTTPWSWLSFTGGIGTDLSSSVDRGVVPAGANPSDPGGQGRETRQDNVGRSADIGLTATVHPGMFSVRTSLGAQYTYQNLDGSNIVAFDLAPGSTSIGTAQLTTFAPDWSETASLGTYGEEVVGVNDRLFLTGSLRLDGSTTFGDAYHPRPFPKAGVSWIVSDEPAFQRIHPPGLTELRLRYSFGASSRYPTSKMKFGTVAASNVVLDDQTINIFERLILANPTVRPERTREAEWGLDATLVSDVQLGLSWFTRRTNDQLNTLTVPYLFRSQWANVGDLAAHGFEATFNAKLYTSRNVSVDLNASYAYNTNKVLSLGAATGFQYLYSSLVVGYPLDASFGETLDHVTDLNGDGIISGGDEVTPTPVHYLGVFNAPNVYTMTPVVSLFSGTLRVSALFDRQTGGVQLDNFTASCGSAGLCVAPYLKSTPLEEQARVFGFISGANIVSSNFTRWRELSITADVPRRIREKLQLSTMSVSLQGRNLLLWTNFTGPDPESIPGLGTVGLGSAINGASGIPQARSWALRFDLSP